MIAPSVMRLWSLNPDCQTVEAELAAMLAECNIHLDHCKEQNKMLKEEIADQEGYAKFITDSKAKLEVECDQLKARIAELESQQSVNPVELLEWMAKEGFSYNSSMGGWCIYDDDCYEVLSCRSHAELLALFQQTKKEEL